MGTALPEHRSQQPEPQRTRMPATPADTGVKTLAEIQRQSGNVSRRAERAGWCLPSPSAKLRPDRHPQPSGTSGCASIWRSERNFLPRSCRRRLSSHGSAAWPVRPDLLQAQIQLYLRSFRNPQEPPEQPAGEYHSHHRPASMGLPKTRELEPPEERRNGVGDALDELAEEPSHQRCRRLGEELLSGEPEVQNGSAPPED